ncbi:MAG: hypothetical protein ACTS74_03760 [Arsenophonus sp. ET-YP4-MAG3]
MKRYCQQVKTGMVRRIVKSIKRVKYRRWPPTRGSLAVYTTKEEIDILVEKLKYIENLLS